MPVICKHSVASRRTNRKKGRHQALVEEISAQAKPGNRGIEHLENEKKMKCTKCGATTGIGFHNRFGKAFPPSSSEVRPFKRGAMRGEGHPEEKGGNKRT